MATCHEAHRSQSFSADGRMVRMTRTVHVLNTTDPVEAHLLIITFSPITFLGLVRESMPRFDNQGGGKWEADVIYASIDLQNAYDPSGDLGTGGAQPNPSSPGPTDPLGTSFSGDTTGGRRRITQSIETIHRVGVGSTGAGESGTNLTVDGADNTLVAPDGYTPVAADVGKSIRITGGTGFTVGSYTITAISGGKWDLNSSPAGTGTAGGVWYIQAPDMLGAINVSGDRIDGCEIPAPSGRWQKKATRPNITMAYYRATKALVGRTNGSTFYNFPIGSLVYLGMQWQPGEGGKVDCVHHFEDAENETNVEVGNGLIIPSKAGQEFIWVRYRPGPSTGDGTVIQVPHAAYCERVLKYGDFADLEIS